MSKIEKSMLLSSKTVKESFKELKAKGFIFTKAEKPDDIGKRRFPIRLVYHPPSEPLKLKPNEITIGPFPIAKDHYSYLKKHFGKKKEFWYVYLSFQKLQYEKLGVTGENYEIPANNEVLTSIANLMTLFEIEKPFIGDSFIWFFPTDNCKTFMSKTIKKHYKSNDYSWWNIVVDLGTEFIPKTAADYPEKFGMFPSDLDKWSRYLPHGLQLIVIRLYIEGTRGGKLKQFSSLSEILKIIEDEFKHLTREKNRTADRELLIKELCDFNQLDYPTDSKSTFDYLQKIGIISIVGTGRKAKYALAEEIPEPRKILKFPPEWKKRAEIYTSTGSVLFAYLDLDEALQ